MFRFVLFWVGQSGRLSSEIEQEKCTAVNHGSHDSVEASRNHVMCPKQMVLFYSILLFYSVCNVLMFCCLCSVLYVKLCFH